MVRASTMAAELNSSAAPEMVHPGFIYKPLIT